ncbi:MAG: hydroxyisourate hydrolase [Elusimicrobia bacterium]|nr:hydroxyisourate hydrolase [Elusimicrobiota bacterium]
MSPITTHVLDTARGKPAKGVPIVLEFQSNGAWKKLAQKTTNANGRISDLIPKSTVLKAGLYRMTFDTASYFRQKNRERFYPSVMVIFEIKNPGEHFHIPLLLSPFGYSTYRGS